MIAVIMAGGRATRFGQNIEKGVLEVGGMTLLEHSAKALRSAGVSAIMVAVTERTPKTKVLAERVGLTTLPTKGEGYHSDAVDILDEHGQYLSLNVDVPFISPEHILRVIEKGADISTTSVVPRNVAMVPPEQDALMKDATGNEFIWVGLNMVTKNPDISLIVFDDPLLTININTRADLELANKIAQMEKS